MTPTYGQMPAIVGGTEIAAMLGISRQLARNLLSRPGAPTGQRLAGGTFYLRADIIEYARFLNRPVATGGGEP